MDESRWLDVCIYRGNIAMTKNDIQIGFWRVFTQCMNEYGIPDIPLIEFNQAGKQGREDAALYFDIGAPRNYGWQGRKYDIKPNESGKLEANHQEVATKAVDITMYALVDERAVDNLTAYDLIDTARMVVASLPFVEGIRKQGIGGIGRATEPVDNTIINDKDDFEKEYTFTFTLTYERTLRPQTGVITEITHTITRV